MVRGKRREETKATEDAEERAAERDERLGTGHNKPELTEDEQRVLLYQHKASYLAAKKKVDDAKAELLRVAKLAKTECGKDAVADIKELITLDEDKGGEALKAHIERKLRLARWANAAVGTQFSLIEDRTPAEDKAFDHGKSDGLAGTVANNPYAAHLPQHKRYLDGWTEGNTVRLSDFRDKLKPLNDKPAADPSQMDLKERKDIDAPVMADLPHVNTADAPFHMPPDEPGLDDPGHPLHRPMPATPDQPE